LVFEVSIGATIAADSAVYKYSYNMDQGYVVDEPGQRYDDLERSEVFY